LSAHEKRGKKKKKRIAHERKKRMKKGERGRGLGMGHAPRGKEMLVGQAGGKREKRDSSSLLR